MLKTLAVVSALALTSCRADDDSDVITLTTANFDEVVGGADRILVEFYAPWCGHCKALAPEYEKAATALKEAGATTKLAKVDATEEGDLAKKFGVRGYPTLKYFVNGNTETPQDYGGGRTESTIVSWLQKRELPAVSEVSADDLAAFVEKEGLTLVLTSNDETKVSEFNTLADAMRDDLTFALVKGDGDSLTLYRDFDGEDKTVDFSGEFNTEAITDFINAERFPLFNEISQQNFGGYMARQLPIAWVALNPAEADVFDKVKAAIVDSGAAADVKGKVSITWIDNAKYQKHVESIGVPSVPGMIIIDGNDKWQFTGDITDGAAVKSFFEKWALGEIEKFLKSEEIPADPIDDNVYVLVGKSFDDIVNSEKDVFVEYYAPWCGHCKKLAPDYAKVGAAFKDVDDVVIAKIDATANDTPEQIQGFPTLIFYPAGKGVGEGIKYQGARTAKDITEWIEENATVNTESLVKTEL